ncbi:SGNH hydrolase-type esterase domain-containing protein [Chytriomyces sp. MP71]|nr:SGNH hydrolase-type esterase domain-containing protein [Chytriomyces sp. MP71]
MIFSVAANASSLLLLFAAFSAVTRVEQGISGADGDLVYPKLVLLGDSLTEYGMQPHGWARNLSAAFNRRVDVVNRGFAGFNSLWLTALVDPVLRELDPASIAIVSVLVGANDCVTDGPRRVPLLSYKENLRSILKRIWTSAPNAKILLATPPPLKSRETESRNLDHCLEYRNAALAVGQTAMLEVPSSSLRVLDTWSYFTGLGIATIYSGYDPAPIHDLFEDNVHWNAKGNLLFADAFLRTIKESWPTLSPDSTSLILPSFRSGLGVLNNSDESIRNWLFENAT